MNEQAVFTLRGRNPDVLTCIANLSNDEVFTPPEFANRMLDTLAEAWAADNDGASIWANSSVRFLDPFTKSGVFLREIAKRLIAANAEDPARPLEDVLAEVSAEVTGTPVRLEAQQLADLLSPEHFVRVRRTWGGPAPEETARPGDV